MSKNALEFPYRNVMLWVILHEVSVLVRIEESLTLGLCLRGLAQKSEEGPSAGNESYRHRDPERTSGTTCNIDQYSVRCALCT